LLYIGPSRESSTHCDCLAVATEWSPTRRVRLLGAPNLLVSRVKIHDAGLVQPALQKAREQFPQALALQTIYYKHVTTVFVFDRVPAQYDQLASLAEALSIVSGDDGEAARAREANVDLMADLMGMRDASPVKYSLLKHAMLLEAGTVLASTAVGLARSE